MSNSSIKSQSSRCNGFCFQQCSDKYQELIVRKQRLNQNGNQSTKLSLKRVQAKNNSELNIQLRSQSQKDLHNKIKTSTDRSRDEKNGNLYDIELFRKKNKVQGEIEQLERQMKKLTNKYEQRLQTLKELKVEIKDRRSLKGNNGEGDNGNRMRVSTTLVEHGGR